MQDQELLLKGSRLREKIRDVKFRSVFAGDPPGPGRRFPRPRKELPYGRSRRAISASRPRRAGAAVRFGELSQGAPFLVRRRFLPGPPASTMPTVLPRMILRTAARAASGGPPSNAVFADIGRLRLSKARTHTHPVPVTVTQPGGGQLFWAPITERGRHGLRDAKTVRKIRGPVPFATHKIYALDRHLVIAPLVENLSIMFSVLWQHDYRRGLAK
jgi:hypothetical protein